jgi:hypothetical protein
MAKMILHYPTQTNLHRRANPHIQHEFYQQKHFSLIGDRKAWIAVGKTLLIFCPMFLAANLWCTNMYEDLTQSVDRFENARHQLVDSQIKMRAKRDQLFSPEHIRILAAESLALDVPEKEQIRFL